ncbi:FAD-binding domain-containing protein [Aspergillus karnatakaensis]|uniref:FAD-binding oxidoreductase n=1 Tax=Aspergillus karnatakaensis TaxID=1810916 RepID=UPI003CCCA4FE
MRLLHVLALALSPLTGLVSASQNAAQSYPHTLATRSWSEAEVKSELGPRLSRKASIIGPSNPQWLNTTTWWNPAAAPTISLVVQVAEEDDVATTVQYCNENDISFFAANSKHGFTVTQTQFEGVLIDLSLLTAITVSRSGKTATIQGGTVGGEVLATLWEKGYVTVTGAGYCPGYIGLSLGGGNGHLKGAYGMVADNFVKMRIVLANGRTVTASKTSNYDLFWAMRGAGQNFGIVTSVESKIYPRPTTDWFWKTYVFTQDQLETVFETLNTFREEGLHLYANGMALNNGAYTVAPPEFGLDEPIFTWQFIYADPSKAHHLAPFDAIPALSVTSGTTPYNLVAEIQGFGKGSPTCEKGLPRLHYTASMQYWNATAQRAVYELFKEQVGLYPAFATTPVVMEDFANDAALDVDGASTAYPWREWPLSGLTGIAIEGDPNLEGPAIAWGQEMRKIWLEGSPELPPSTYSNYAHGDEQLEWVYGEAWRLQRLRRLKAKYDPHGRFDYYNPITV